MVSLLLLEGVLVDDDVEVEGGGWCATEDRGC